MAAAGAGAVAAPKKEVHLQPKSPMNEVTQTASLLLFVGRQLYNLQVQAATKIQAIARAGLARKATADIRQSKNMRQMAMRE
jgi:hypothetical protein